MQNLSRVTPRPLSYLAATGLVLLTAGVALILVYVGVALRGEMLDLWSQSLAYAIAVGAAIWTGLQGAGDVPARQVLRLRSFRPLMLVGIVPLAFGASVVFSEADNWVQERFPASADEIAEQARLLGRTALGEWAALLVFVI